MSTGAEIAPSGRDAAAGRFAPDTRAGGEIAVAGGEIAVAGDAPAGRFAPGGPRPLRELAAPRGIAGLRREMAALGGIAGRREAGRLLEAVAPRNFVARPRIVAARPRAVAAPGVVAPRGIAVPDNAAAWEPGP